MGHCRAIPHESKIVQNFFIFFAGTQLYRGAYTTPSGLMSALKIKSCLVTLIQIPGNAYDANCSRYRGIMIARSGEMHYNTTHAPPDEQQSPIDI